MCVFGITMAITVQKWRWLAALAMVALLAGCGGGSGGSNTAAPRSVSATLSDGLVGTMTADQSTIPVGGTIHYTLTLTNKTDHAVTYEAYRFSTFETDTGGSLRVRDPQGKTEWPVIIGNNLSLGPPMTLAPGQSQTASYTVSGDVALPSFDTAGPHQAVADFLVSPGTTNDIDQLISAETAPLTVQVR